MPSQRWEAAEMLSRGVYGRMQLVPQGVIKTTNVSLCNHGTTTRTPR